MSPNIAVLLVDPLNDFIHPDGKLYSLLKESLDESDAVKNMVKLVKGARDLHIPIYYGLHQTYRPGNYDGWSRTTERHHRLKKLQLFQEGSLGAEVHAEMQPSLQNGDVVVSRHWNSRYS